jgi:hypothetical protein
VQNREPASLRSDGFAGIPHGALSPLKGTSVYGLGLVSLVGFGRARPVTSNATVSGREENRRAEIGISGPGIGGMALWERTYALKTGQLTLTTGT